MDYSKPTAQMLGQRKLLTNEIDNVEVFFKKSTRPNNVS